MESTFKELEVITHSDFFINAHSVFKDERMRIYLKDIIFNTKTEFRNLNGSLMNNEDVLRMITTLSQIKDYLPKAPKFEFPEKVLNCSNKTRNPIYLMEFSLKYLKSFTDEFGYHGFNSDSFKEGIDQALLYTERLQGRRKYKITNSPHFKYSDLFSFKQPANYFILNDQYYGNLSKDEIKSNFLPLIKNCTSLLDNNYERDLTLITKIKKDFKKDSKSIFNEEYSIKKLEENYKTISNELTNKINFKLIAFKEYKAEEDLKRDGLSKNEIEKIKEIRKSLKKLHDRFFISNYLIGESTNSLNFLNNFGINAECELTLSTTLDITYIHEFELNQKAIDKCLLYLKDDFAKTYFLKFDKK
jgi:hypothetical protein